SHARTRLSGRLRSGGDRCIGNSRHYSSSVRRHDHVRRDHRNLDRWSVCSRHPPRTSPRLRVHGHRLRRRRPQRLPQIRPALRAQHLPRQCLEGTAGTVNAARRHRRACRRLCHRYRSLLRRGRVGDAGCGVHLPRGDLEGPDAGVARDPAYLGRDHDHHGGRRAVRMAADGCAGSEHGRQRPARRGCRPDPQGCGDPADPPVRRPVARHRPGAGHPCPDRSPDRGEDGSRPVPDRPDLHRRPRHRPVHAAGWHQPVRRLQRRQDRPLDRDPRHRAVLGLERHRPDHDRLYPGAHHVHSELLQLLSSGAAPARRSSPSSSEFSMSYQPSKTLPAGVSSQARALGVLDGRAFYVKSSKGARISDSYGTSFVDYGMAMGANLLGHAHPAIVKACTEALENGPMPGFPNMLENEAADALVKIGGERITRLTFTTTGTEAVHLANRIVRAKTGRKLIAKSVGGYDGWFEEVRFGLVNSPETARTNERPVRSDVTLLRVNDMDDLTSLFATYGDQLAAVLIEPLLGNTACLKPEREWVELLNSLAATHGVMIISDEVMAGLRQGFGLVADTIGLKADLVTMGKAIGTGVPVAAVLGTNDAFSVCDDNTVPRFGTYHGNPMVSAAILATT